MFDHFRTILIGGDNARRAAEKIGEFDYLCGLPFSVASFVNPGATQKHILVNSGWNWHDLPILETFDRAMEYDRHCNSAIIYFSAKHVLEWVYKILKYPQIKNMAILAEDVPERDARELVYLAQQHNVNIVGPSSTGIVVAGRGRLGEIGGDWRNLNLCHLNKPGNVGLITKSGGMSGEFIWVIFQNSPGISTAVQIGGDAFPATDYVWWLEKFSTDPKTKVVVMAGEAGGDLEERAAEWYKEYNKINKVNKFRLIAVVSGKFLEQMPKGQKFGHAGAKQEESGFGSAKHKIEALRAAGVEVVEFEELGTMLRNFKF